MEFIVKIKQGGLKGVKKTTLDGKEYFSFMGIPYAEPPVENLRFKDPVPIASWSGIKDATKEGGTVAQINIYNGEYSGGDDCLYINVHTPQLKTDETHLLPVMVKIHGGGFVNGSGNTSFFGPDYIVEQDTILVTFNYRLGVLGFLCTDPTNARGDMGLRDQNLALKWVQQNINSFNGDPNNVTIFGISAGSASVEYHLLSPLSENLFQKAIMQSGSVLNAWARVKTPIDHAIRLAKTFGYNSNETEGLFEFIDTIATEDLVRVSTTLLNDEDLLEAKLFPFTPVVNEFKDGREFLNEEPIDLLRTGKFHKVPIISGVCEKEGMMMRLFYQSEQWKNNLNQSEFIKAIPNCLNKNLENLDEKLAKLYRKRDDDKNVDDNVIYFLSDLAFVGGVFYSLDQRLKHNHNDEFFYHFIYDGKMNMYKIELKFDEIGACHADDWAYLGPVSSVSTENAAEADWLTKSRMVEMWTNFAKTGNPTPTTTNIINEKWLPVTKEIFHYLEIGLELKLFIDPLPERRQLWKDLYSNL